MASFKQMRWASAMATLIWRPIGPGQLSNAKHARLPRERYVEACGRPSPWHHGPIIEVQDHVGIIILPRFVGEIRAWPVLGGDEAQPQGADIVAARQLQPLDDLRPGEHGVAGEQRR